MTDVESIQRTFVDGLASDEGFERHGPRRATWDVSRGCEDPVGVTRASRKTGLAKNLAANRGGILNRLSVKAPPMIELNMLVPCRRCPTCLRKHAHLWRTRAMVEIEASNRTWFGTLTCKPDVHVWIDSVCSSKHGDFWSMPQSKKFEMQAQVLGAEVTKYLKRLRKESGHRFRYLLVTELHDGVRTSEEMRGRPHLHMLLHEYAGQQIPKSLLEKQWQHGFSSWRLTEGQGAAWYISKYISKASEARTRASLGYGISQ